MIIQWSPGVTLEKVEEQVIKSAFIHYGKNKTATANALGISVRTLDGRLEKYELDEQERKRREEQDAKQRAQFLDRQRGIIPNPYRENEYEARERAKALEAQRRSESVSGTQTGVHLEPVKEIPAQQSVPVQKRDEVQKVLPGKTPAHSAGKAR